MPFCEQCGGRLAEGATGCPHCGRRTPGEPPAGPSAESLPPPPPGYAASPAPAGPFPHRRHSSMRVGGASPAAAASGFPGAVIPPLAAAFALIVTTAYATVYSLLIEGGSIDPADVFLAAAAPTVLAAPFAGYGSLGSWLHYAPFGGGWAIAIPLLAVAALTAGLASRTELGAGGRLAMGSLACVPLALLAGLLTLLAHLLVSGGITSYYGLGELYGLSEMIPKAAAGAAIVGLLGGLLGSLASLAIRPPIAVRVLQASGTRPG